MELLATDRSLSSFLPASRSNCVIPAVDAGEVRLTVPPGPLDEAFVRAAGHAARALAAPVHDALVDFADAPGPAAVLMLRRVPIGRIPATPPEPGAYTGKRLDSEFTLLTVARRLGQPIGYFQEHGGGLVQDIVPARAAESRQLSTSSSVTLQWHTETAFHPHKPRYVLLVCVRGDPHARTLLCSVAAVLPHLDDVIDVLRAPRFRTRPDASFCEIGARGDLGSPMAVITGTEDDPMFTYDEDLMVGTDPEAERALARLTRVVHERAVAVVLEAGDLLVLDNHRVVHGRSPFAARFDGADRWVQRAFVVADLDASAQERTGRIITTRF